MDKEKTTGFEPVVHKENLQTTGFEPVILRATNIMTGDYVLFGRYYNEPILWRSINTNDDKSVMLLSEKILCFKAFDAAESGIAGWEEEYVGRRVKYRYGEGKYGSSYWKNSNIREWLNSSQKRVAYSTKPPARRAVWEGYNAYDKELGFLCNFTAHEIDAIQKVKRYEETDYEETDMVYLLPYEAPKSGYIFSRDGVKVGERRRLPTAAAVRNNEYSGAGIRVDNYCKYWLRDSYTSFNNCVRYDGDGWNDGNIRKEYACYGYMGVLPVLNLKSEILAYDGEGSLNNPWIVKE